MADPTPLSRKQIAAFVGNDPEAIRAIERLFVVAGQTTPADLTIITQLVLDATVDAGTAANSAGTALSVATSAERLAELAALDDTKAEVAMSVATSAERLAELAVLDDTRAEVAMSVATNAERLAELAATAPAPLEQRLDQLQDVQSFGATAGMVVIYDATQRRWTANTITSGSNIVVTSTDGSISVATAGASGSFMSAGLQTVTVVNGIITSIV